MSHPEWLYRSCFTSTLESSPRVHLGRPHESPLGPVSSRLSLRPLSTFDLRLFRLFIHLSLCHLRRHLMQTHLKSRLLKYIPLNRFLLLSLLHKNFLTELVRISDKVFGPRPLSSFYGCLVLESSPLLSQFLCSLANRSPRPFVYVPTVPLPFMVTVHVSSIWFRISFEVHGPQGVPQLLIKLIKGYVEHSWKCSMKSVLETVRRYLLDRRNLAKCGIVYTLEREDWVTITTPKLHPPRLVIEEVS